MKKEKDKTLEQVLAQRKDETMVIRNLIYGSGNRVYQHRKCIGEGRRRYNL